MNAISIFVSISRDLFVSFLGLFCNLQFCDEFEPKNLNLDELLPWVPQVYCKFAEELRSIHDKLATPRLSLKIDQSMFISIFQSYKTQGVEELCTEPVQQVTIVST